TSLGTRRFGLLPAGDKPSTFAVVPVEFSSKTLKDAVNEAMRDWVMNFATMHFLIGSCFGPRPFLTIVRDCQKVIGREIKA
ncbi:hypothetical protein EDD15DRAFT_90166, partial [Pisolithus albus]